MGEEEKANSGKYGREYFILGTTVLSGQYIYSNRISVRINICSETNSDKHEVAILMYPGKFK